MSLFRQFKFNNVLMMNNDKVEAEKIILYPLAFGSGPLINHMSRLDRKMDSNAFECVDSAGNFYSYVFAGKDKGVHLVNKDNNGYAANDSTISFVFSETTTINIPKGMPYNTPDQAANAIKSKEVQQQLADLKEKEKELGGAGASIAPKQTKVPDKATTTLGGAELRRAGASTVRLNQTTRSQDSATRGAIVNGGGKDAVKPVVPTDTATTTRVPELTVAGASAVRLNQTTLSRGLEAGDTIYNRGRIDSVAPQFAGTQTNFGSNVRPSSRVAGQTQKKPRAQSSEELNAISAHNTFTNNNKHTKTKVALVATLIGFGAIIVGVGSAYMFREDIVKALSNIGTLSQIEEINEIIENNETLQKMQEAMVAGDMEQANQLFREVTEGTQLSPQLQALIESGKFPTGPGEIIPPETINPENLIPPMDPEYEFTSVGEKLKPVLENPAVMGGIAGGAALIAIAAIIALIAVKEYENKQTPKRFKETGDITQLKNFLDAESDLRETLKNAIRNNGGTFKSLGQRQEEKGNVAKIVTHNLMRYGDSVFAKQSRKLGTRPDLESTNVVDRFVANMDELHSLTHDGAGSHKRPSAISKDNYKKIAELKTDIAKDADKIYGYLDKDAKLSNATDRNIQNSFQNYGGEKVKDLPNKFKFNFRSSNNLGRQTDESLFEFP